MMMFQLPAVQNTVSSSWRCLGRVKKEMSWVVVAPEKKQNLFGIICFISCLSRYIQFVNVLGKCVLELFVYKLDSEIK